MADVAITGVPNTKVCNLVSPTVTWDGSSMTLKASWKVPSQLAASTNARRAEQLSAWFGIYTTGEVSNIKRFGTNHYGSPATVVNPNAGSAEWTFSMSQFFPFKADGPRVTSVYAVVQAVNSKGSAAWGDTAVSSLSFLSPMAPRVAKPTLDADGRVTCEVESTATDKGRHWARTAITRACYDSQTGNTVTTTYTATATDYTVPAVDVAGLDGITGSRYWSCTVTAEARGVHGESAERTGTLYLAQPNRPAISAKVDGTKAASRVAVSIDARASETHPVTGMRLQKLQSVAASTAAQAEALDGWEDMDYADNGRCTMLACLVSDVRPDPDTRTWLRVKAWDEDEARLVSFSAPVRLSALETKSPTASNDVCGIIALTPSKAGTSFTLRAGWTEDSPNTGLEVSWADSASAWTSTDGPSTSTFEGNGSASTGTGYARERTVTVSGLASGTTYWVRVRRYLEGDSKTTYTAYSKTMSVRTESAEDDACGIASVSPRADGTGATVIVGFSEDSPNTGTELTWSTDPNAWYSTEQPQTFEATWHDSSSRYPEWGGTAMIFLRGLEAGTTYYVRARRYLEAGGNRTYTAYSATQSFMTPAQGGGPSSTSRCGIVSAQSGEDGTSVDLVIGWTESEGHDATEVTWSDREDAWESTDQPDSFSADWADAESQSSAWRATQAVHVEGLEQGVTYWLRARRTRSDGSRSAWTDAVSAIPEAAPTAVTLSAPAFVRRGSELALAWAFGGGSAQRGWRVMCGATVVASGTDAACACVVGAERLAELVGDGDSVTLSVEVSTGGAYVASDPVTVGVADAPTLSVAAATVTAQPMRLSLACSATADVAIVVTALGARGSHPGGERTQAAGDTVWGDALAPAWAASGSSQAATVVAPTGLDLWDGASYLVEAVATDRRTGLRSDAAHATVSVDWAHKAPTPSASIAVTPFDATDADGFRTLGATIALTAPTGAAAGDRYDVWRVTADGAERIADGVGTASTVTDRFAPFGEAAYRVCSRTADGDLDWLDYGYELPCGDLRVDWAGGYAHMPYDLVAADEWEKDFEAVRDMAGGTEGYWGPSTSRRASLSADIVVGDDEPLARALAELAQHAGPAFVRTPYGAAYQADVQVSLDRRATSGAVAVSLDATQVALQRGCMADVSDGEGS